MVLPLRLTERKCSVKPAIQREKKHIKSSCAGLMLYILINFRLIGKGNWTCVCETQMPPAATKSNYGKNL